MVNSFIDFLSAYPSKYHVVEGFRRLLVNAGFTELCLKKEWNIKPGGRYFTTRGGSSLIAFVVGTEAKEKGYRIIATHSDTPSLRVKPTPDMLLNGMHKCNTEIYGGAILYSWFDRPLSIAGRISVETEDPLHPKDMLVDLRKPVGIIPSVAIHFNRQVNESFTVNKQIDMSVLLQTADGMKGQMTLLEIVASSVGVSTSDILDYDLYFYDTTPTSVIGLNEEDSIISGSRLDDLMMAFPAFEALCRTSTDGGIGRMVCLFDNEEVGSLSKQGANSPLLRNIFDRISEKLNYTTEESQRVIYNSFLMSSDVAHALHPNHSELHDPTSRPVLNGGVVCKINANQKYMSDGNSSAILQSLCRQAGVSCQIFVNRSDMAGGSTLGNIVTSQLDIHGVDIGCPILGMHSLRETAGVKDFTDSLLLFDTFFKNSNY